MSRTRITIEGTGELLHEGPTAPSAWERLEARTRAEEDSYRRAIETSWGVGWYDVRKPHRVAMQGQRARPVG